MQAAPVQPRRKMNPRTDRALDPIALAGLAVVLVMWVLVEPGFILPMLLLAAVTVGAVAIAILLIARRRRRAGIR